MPWPQMPIRDEQGTSDSPYASDYDPNSGWWTRSENDDQDQSGNGGTK
ncbi:hypothetical protein [Streptomyces sp. AJS327]|nr:hypothetical protein [Streptomyces sp. AJS327]